MKKVVEVSLGDRRIDQRGCISYFFVRMERRISTNIISLAEVAHLDEEAISRALSRLFWGKKWREKRFSMKKLILAILKKRLFGK